MKKLMMVAVAGMLAATFAFAQDAEIVKVRGKGTGADKTEALKDAYRDAVERAVGLYVDAEQMMKNEELVKDQILTQSNAYIEKYDVAKETTKPNGLVEVQILAEVRKTALTKKLSDVMPTKTFKLNSAVVQNLHAKLVTDEKRTTDGAALLRNALEGIDPVRQLVKVSLVSPEAKIVDAKGRGGRNEGGFVTLRYAFKFEVDCNRYVSGFLPHLQKTFEQISTKTPKMIRLTDCRRHNGIATETTFDNMTADCGYLGTKDLVGSSDGEKIEIGRLVLRGGTKYWGKRIVAILTDVNSNAICAKALVCNIDELSSKIISEWARSRKSVRYNVVVSSKDGSDICVTPVEIYGLCPFAFNGMPRYGDGRGFFAITPFVGGCASTYYQWVDCKIPKDELPNVANITIEFAE